ncbi:hypothetical protein FQA47_021868 [Oryzias melastigma]|uniref:Uncharacterized protein n=1 Tax=Oryzias melastigma TaxID=30732 RepID=A0A834F3K8_ORYME|nr:hypothetical protein FQA47_021868 [Oryzias melastigma]
MLICSFLIYLSGFSEPIICTIPVNVKNETIISAPQNVTPQVAFIHQLEKPIPLLLSNPSSSSSSFSSGRVQVQTSPKTLEHHLLRTRSRAEHRRDQRRKEKQTHNLRRC